MQCSLDVGGQDKWLPKGKVTGALSGVTRPSDVSMLICRFIDSRDSNLPLGFIKRFSSFNVGFFPTSLFNAMT